ncbi:hypothetical protein B9479_001724 [Cryptococcus floricola]|uniref:Secreted protein n=1 Tax=Cryptococcus floricola TaxID=2591691 RepID=A0A5D3B3N8_9TREE|nr:hypothetical protein B9479_001724 [Cryptococcus floricola]
MSFTTYVAALLVLVAPAALAAPAAAAEPTLEGQNFGAPGGDPPPTVRHWLATYHPLGLPDDIAHQPTRSDSTPNSAGSETAHIGDAPEPYKHELIERVFATFPDEL